MIIVTLNRPDCVRRCLQALAAQEPEPEQVIVVDSSRDGRTRSVMQDFPDVHYLARPDHSGRMTASRNAGLMFATGDIIAFLDDDAYAHPGWLKNLLAAYDSPEIGAVGGRALNAQPGEDTRGIKEIGRLTPNGFLTGYFAADPGETIEVDHIIGCNMSFRREVIARLGGFREDFWGISGLCEDSDMCLRVKTLGYKLRFQPAACADHAGAPQSVGQRFDSRYQFYHRRNSITMLIRNFGFGSMIWRFFAAIAAQSAREFVRNVASACGRLVASIAGSLFGLVNGVTIFVRNGRDPARRDAAALKIRAALEANTRHAVVTESMTETMPAEP